MLWFVEKSGGESHLRKSSCNCFTIKIIENQQERNQNMTDVSLPLPDLSFAV